MALKRISPDLADPQTSLADYLVYRDFPFHDYRFEEFGDFLQPSKEKFVAKTTGDIDNAFKAVLENVDWSKTGIMLSGGVDSVLVASYAPKGTLAFTLKYPEMEGIDETADARHFAEALGLKLIEVPVTFEDVLGYQDVLMKFRKEPLQAIEVPLYKIGLVAREHGLDSLLTGLGADTKFGGFYRLMSRTWTKEEFIEAYRFVDPAKMLTPLL